MLETISISQLVSRKSKAIIKFFIHHYLGGLLEKELMDDQITSDLARGSCIVREVALNKSAINGLFDHLNFPFTIIDGFIEELSASVPWSQILTDNCFFEINGLQITLQPKTAEISSIGNLVDSMMESMTTSFQMAQDIVEDMKQETNVDNSSKDTEDNLDVVNMLAAALETIYKKVKLRLLNTTIRLEYAPKNSKTSIAIELRIKHLDFFDIAGCESEAKTDEGRTVSDKSPYITKKIIIEGIEIFTDEFLNIDLSAPQFQAGLDIIGNSSDLDNARSSQESDDESVKSSPAFNNLSNPILFVKVIGRNVVVLKYKQNDEMQGPKYDFEVNVASFFSFLTPRQVYLINEFITAFGKISSSQSLANMDQLQQIPMEHEHYRVIESQLQNQVRGLPTRDLQSNYGWSTTRFTESDDFVPMGEMPDGGDFNDLTTSNISFSSEMNTSFNSNYTSNLHDVSSRSYQSNNDTYAETLEETVFQMRIAIVASVFTHEDILNLSTDNGIPTSASVKDLQGKSNNFFNTIRSICNCKTLPVITQISNNCSFSHLFMVCGPINVKCRIKNSSNSDEIDCSFRFGTIEISECLVDSNPSVDKEYMDILHFRSESFNSKYNEQYIKPSPFIFIDIKKTIKYQSIGRIRRARTPQVNVKINTREFTLEVDPSLIDRISGWLTKVNIFQKFAEEATGFTPSLSNRSYFDRVIENECNKSEVKIDICANFDAPTIKLRFPIPDLRSPTDADKLPWWKRNLRKDTLILYFRSGKFNSSFDTRNPNTTSYKFIIGTIHIVYQENDTDKPISLLRSITEDNSAGEYEEQTIVVTVEFSSSSSRNTVSPTEDVMGRSTFGFLSNLDKSEGPFARRNLCVEDKQLNYTVVNDKPSLNQFMDKAERSCEIVVNINLPNLEVVLPSKHILEMIYNRLGSDLLLWCPSSPKFQSASTSGKVFGSVQPVISFGSQDRFTMYHSNENEFGVESQYFSPNEEMRPLDEYNDDEVKPTWLTLNLQIEKGTIFLRTPCRDEKDNVLPGCHGEFCLTINKGNIFLAINHEGNENLVYNIITINRLDLYHQSILTTTELKPLDQREPIDVSKLQKLLYSNEEGVTTKLGGKIPYKSNEVFDNFSFVAKMKFDEINNSKVNVLAINFRGLTLRHYMSTLSTSWVTQLKDMFTIEDYSINGYTLPTISTDLDLNLMDFAIDYRPLNIPMRSMVTVETFTFSTNFSIEDNSTVMKFIIEDAALFLSKNLTENLNLYKNYVCLVDVDVFDITIQFNPDNKQQIELFNSKIIIRACYDSLAAFQEFIVYFSNYGDLVKEADEDFQPQIIQSRVKENIENNIEKSRSKDKIISDLMSEAMEESVCPELCSDEAKDHEPQKGILKDFYFRGEETKTKVDEKCPSDDAISNELSCALKDALDDIPEYFNDTNIDSDEFCVLDQDFGIGITSRVGGPNIEFFENCVGGRPKVNFFEVEDNAPKKVRLPNFIINLKKLNIDFQFFGGSDFSSVESLNRNVSFDVPNYLNHQGMISVNMRNESVNFSGSSSSLSSIGSNSSPGMQRSNHDYIWQAHGGPKRELRSYLQCLIRKVSYNQERYDNDEKLPVVTHLLSIQDIEIKDHVEKSKIKSLFYQFGSEQNPLPSHGNIISIRALIYQPDGPLGQNECDLSASVRSLRFNFDQHSVIFALDSYHKYIEEINAGSENNSTFVQEERSSSTSIASPVCTVNPIHTSKKLNESILLDESSVIENTDLQGPKSNDKTYFRRVKFSPGCDIRLDYHGKFDKAASQGMFINIIMAFGQLNNSQLHLRSFNHKNGLLGIDRVFQFVAKQFINDVQYSSILSGIGPMNSVVTLIGGISDLFRLPYEQYNKDGRVMRGLHKGTVAFSTATAHAALDLTGRFFSTLQLTAETMYDIVSYEPSRSRMNLNYSHPQDLREGVSQAIQQVHYGLAHNASNIMSSIETEHEAKGVTGVFGAVARKAAPASLEQIINVSGAVATVLDGIKNSVIPEARKDAIQKWK